MSPAVDRVLEGAVVLTLLLNAGLALAVGVDMARHAVQDAPQGLALLAPVAAPSGLPATPVVHPAAPPGGDAVQAQAESCGRLETLLASLDGQLSREGLTSPVHEAVVIHLVSAGACNLDDPDVRAVLQRYRAAFREAGLTPPPLLPQVER